MAKVGSLIVDLALESAQFIAGLKKSQAATTQAASQISSAMNIAKTSLAGFAGGFVGAFSIGLINDRIKEAFDYGDAIVDLADRTGATTKTIQELRYAAQMAGSDFETSDAAIEKFAKNLGSAQNGNKALTKTFADLGVTSTDTDTALKQTMDGISKLGTVTQRNQKTIEVFGKSAGTLTMLMGDGAKGFDTVAEAARSYGLVLDDGLLRNGGKVNDQLDTMKMILNAQMAGAIIQNADAIMALANSFVQAASAAASFFGTLDTKRLMSVANGINMDSDIPTMIAGRLQGKSPGQVADEARAKLKTTKVGREALFNDLTTRYNDGIRSGRNKNDADMMAIRAERDDIARAEARSRHGIKINPPAGGGGNLPRPTGGKPSNAKPSSSPANFKTDDELAAQWEKAFLSSRSDLYRAQATLSNDPSERQELEANQLRNRYFSNDFDLTADTGTEKEVREGKKRYTEAQAKQLKQIEKEIFDAEYDATIRDRDTQIANDRYELAANGLQIDSEMLSAQANLARSTKERRDKAMALVQNSFEQERLQLEHTIELEKLGKATKAEREAAERRLKALPAMKALAEEGVRKQNQSPLEAYLDQIPQTSDEINDAMEKIEVEGLDRLQDGIMGLIDGSKSFGEVWQDLTKNIISGLIKIGLQQAIIKPLGGLLFGGGSGGGGGLLGSIFGGIVKGSVKGARANGGMTSPGRYLVGERGAEIVDIGANANVIPNSRLRGAVNDNNSGVTVNFGNITSNDPAAMKAAALEVVSAMMPMLNQNATNATYRKLNRPKI